MIVAGIPDPLFFALVTVTCLLVAIVLIIFMARNTQADQTNAVSIRQQLFSGATLTETGLRYRMGVFIAFMFMFMNIVATVVTFLATIVPPQ
jgi:uncharacterized membrane protein YqiK